MNHKKDVPAKINSAFINRRVDAAFISSIKAQKYPHVNLGIIAKKDVRSVILIPSRNNKKDIESASSNLLAQLLGLHGEVLIGDKALRYALKNDNYIDLAKEWNSQEKLPFVFALLCYHKEKKLYTKIEQNFLKQEVKIPSYLLKKAAQRTDLRERDILEYLELISYGLDYKSKRGLQRFYTKAKRH